MVNLLNEKVVKNWYNHQITLNQCKAVVTIKYSFRSILLFIVVIDNIYFTRRFSYYIASDIAWKEFRKIFLRHDHI